MDHILSRCQYEDELTARWCALRVRAPPLRQIIQPFPLFLQATTVFLSVPDTLPMLPETSSTKRPCQPAAIPKSTCENSSDHENILITILRTMNLLTKETGKYLKMKSVYLYYCIES